MHTRDRRLYLRVALKLMVSVGLIALAVPFLAGIWSPHEVVRGVGEQWQRTISLGELLPGEMLDVEWVGGPLRVYRRTSDEIEELEHGSKGLAAGARGGNPAAESTPSRSLHPEFFVFSPLVRERGCLVQLQIVERAGSRRREFRDLCSGARFDLAGRVFDGAAGAVSSNLSVPPYVLLDEQTIRMQVWRR